MSVGGFYTAQEVSDLLAAKDYENSQMQAAWDGLPLDVKNSDTAKLWLVDWTSYRNRYSSARTIAQAAIGIAGAMPLSPVSLPLTDKAFRGILDAETAPTNVNSVYPIGARPYGPGDKQDLYNRLLALRNYEQVDFSKMPQPTAGSDVDLNLYKSADKFVKGFEKTAAAARSEAPWILGGLGLVALAFGIGYVKGKV